MLMKMKYALLPMAVSMGLAFNTAYAQQQGVSKDEIDSRFIRPVGRIRQAVALRHDVACG
jgi:hypothetical protein